MSLTENEAQEIGHEEDQRWKEAHVAIVDEMRRSESDFHQNRQLARELTSQIVASKRDEDKAALASDEAVAHGLTTLIKNKSEGLESLEEQPYFARVVTLENDREVEFRLGTASLTAQRIIDWRKAPISKLYYDYKEGDYFEETIQGREREGLIKLRRSYHGKKNELQIIETPQGTLHLQNKKWYVSKGSEPLSRSSGHDGHLPPILSLITADQFRLITQAPEKAMVIQGIAGSGKTTVALHRLAWLLHADNGGAKAEKCLVVLLNRSLKAYIETTLPELNIHQVGIRTFSQWANNLVSEIAGPRPTGSSHVSEDLEKFKSARICLDSLHQYFEKFPDRNSKNFIEDLFGFFSFLITQDLFWPKWALLRDEIRLQVERQFCTPQDDALLLHLIYAEHGYYPTRSPQSLGICDHIVIDEAQDFGWVEIHALLNALDEKRTVTIVGDVAQKIFSNRHFESWDQILKEAGFEDTTPISLSVSHRTTQEIMEIAAHLRNEPLSSKEYGTTRRGEVPTFIPVETMEIFPHLIGQWIKERLEENPRSLSAIICRQPNEAQALAEILRRMGHPSVRFGHRDQFDFSPGVIVTSAHQVKGLEFRNVLIVEPSEENYPSNQEEARNLLYVAVTRAELRLDLMGIQPPSALLPPVAEGSLKDLSHTVNEEIEGWEPDDSDPED